MLWSSKRPTAGRPPPDEILRGAQRKGSPWATGTRRRRPSGHFAGRRRPSPTSQRGLWAPSARDRRARVLRRHGLVGPPGQQTRQGEECRTAGESGGCQVRCLGGQGVDSHIQGTGGDDAQRPTSTRGAQRGEGAQGSEDQRQTSDVEAQLLTGVAVDGGDLQAGVVLRPHDHRRYGQRQDRNGHSIGSSTQEDHLPAFRGQQEPGRGVGDRWRDAERAVALGPLVPLRSLWARVGARLTASEQVAASPVRAREPAGQGHDHRSWW